MSARPREVLDAGSRFSLRDALPEEAPAAKPSRMRSIFSSAKPSSAPPVHQLRFQLEGLKKPAPAPTRLPTNLNLSLGTAPFTAPSNQPKLAMPPSPAKAPMVSSADKTALETAQKEVMRLSAFVDDLQTRLGTTNSKLQATEAQLTRSSQTLLSERHQSTTRIGNLGKELSAARDVETKLRSELATRPSKPKEESKFQSSVENVLAGEEQIAKQRVEVASIDAKTKALSEVKATLETEVKMLQEQVRAATIELTNAKEALTTQKMSLETATERTKEAEGVRDVAVNASATAEAAHVDLKASVDTQKAMLAQLEQRIGLAEETAKTAETASQRRLSVVRSQERELELREEQLIQRAVTLTNQGAAKTEAMPAPTAPPTNLLDTDVPLAPLPDADVIAIASSIDLCCEHGATVTPPTPPAAAPTCMPKGASVCGACAPTRGLGSALRGKSAALANAGLAASPTSIVFGTDAPVSIGATHISPQQLWYGAEATGVEPQHDSLTQQLVANVVLDLKNRLTYQAELERNDGGAPPVAPLAF